MPLWCLTKEKVEELLKQRDRKVSGWAELGARSAGVSFHHGNLLSCREES